MSAMVTWKSTHHVVFMVSQYKVNVTTLWKDLIICDSKTSAIQQNRKTHISRRHLDFFKWGILRKLWIFLWKKDFLPNARIHPISSFVLSDSASDPSARRWSHWIYVEKNRSNQREQNSMQDLTRKTKNTSKNQGIELIRRKLHTIFNLASF